jgi:hypothetical protein
MQTLGLNDDDDNEIPKKFWARQFQDQPTKPQRRFDWIFGVVMPAVCIFFDPFVFSNHLGGDQPLLGGFKPFVYLLSFVSILMMAAWLLWREKLKGLSALLTGVFAVSALMSAAIGGVLFPFSLIGLFFLIGVLGFTPLFTSVIYMRNSVRAFRAAKIALPHNTVVYSAALASLFALVVPYVTNVEIARSLERIKFGDVQTVRAEGRKLWFVSPLVNASALQTDYWYMPWETRETEKARALEEVYHNLTGEDIVKYQLPID